MMQDYPRQMAVSQLCLDASLPSTHTTVYSLLCLARAAGYQDDLSCGDVAAYIGPQSSFSPSCGPLAGAKRDWKYCIVVVLMDLLSSYHLMHLALPSAIGWPITSVVYIGHQKLQLGWLLAGVQFA